MRLRLLAILLLLPTFSHAADVNLVINILECESSGRHDAVGDDGVSVGIAQFQKPTFEMFKKKAGHSEWHWKNPIHQLRLMSWMLDHGYGRHWTCYRKLTKTGEFKAS